MENREMDQNRTQTTITKKKRKFSEVVRENLQKITILLISFIYIIQGMFQIKHRDTTIWNILGSIGISIIVGFIIASNLRSMGIRDGRRSEIFANSMLSYAKAKEKATPEFDKLAAWCEYKNAQELEFKKKGIIQGAGLNWKAFKLGYYDDEKNLTKLNEKQLEALEEAKYCKIYRINSQELLSDLPSLFSKSGSRFGQSQNEYLIKGNIADIFSRIIIGVVGGLYGLYPLFSGENIAQVISGIIWNMLQVIIFLAFGLLKYNQSKSFMEDEYRQTHIVQKTELLNEFTVTMQKNPSIVDTYEEQMEAEMEEYINNYMNKRNKLKENDEDEQEGVLD